jgi:ElaB/YqjD/DUF883 family membrane-anchored ribosome-binding protein
MIKAGQGKIRAEIKSALDEMKARIRDNRENMEANQEKIVSIVEDCKWAPCM